MPLTIRTIVWMEVEGDELLDAWNGTFQGQDCVPPHQMWRAILHPLIEIWLFTQDDTYWSYSRWRPNPSSWWYARASKDSFTLEEAKDKSIRLMQDELNRIRARFLAQQPPTDLDPIFLDIIDLGCSGFDLPE